MPAPFSTEALDREGFVLVMDALERPWVNRLRCAFEQAPAQKDGTEHAILSPSTPERQAWLALKEHPVVLAAAEHVLGRDFRVGDPHGRNPLPGYGQQGLHADWMPRASVQPYFVLTTIFMLDDFTADNGATRLVPGSHRLVRPIPKRLGQPEARHPSEMIVTGRAGSVLVLNGHTWHSGTRNASKGPRRTVQLIAQAAGIARQIGEEFS
jgi:ectoine hydroxylase-related dioxygenase (phytanoyl-CoA dioxygenase family)